VISKKALGGLTGYQHSKDRMQSIYQAARSLFRDEGYRLPIPSHSFSFPPTNELCRGFLRGIEVQVTRGFLGAGTQLPTYNILKEYMGEKGFDKDSPRTHIICSAISAGRKGSIFLSQLLGLLLLSPSISFCSFLFSPLPSPLSNKGVSILFCNPADVIRTRVYNQPFDPVTGVIKP
jgi:hypothetical protein